MDDFLWVLGFIARNVVQGFIVGAMVCGFIYWMSKRGDK